MHQVLRNSWHILRCLSYWFLSCRTALVQNWAINPTATINIHSAWTIMESNSLGNYYFFTSFNRANSTGNRWSSWPIISWTILASSISSRSINSYRIIFGQIQTSNMTIQSPIILRIGSVSPSQSLGSWCISWSILNPSTLVTQWIPRNTISQLASIIFKWLFKRWILSKCGSNIVTLTVLVFFSSLSSISLTSPRTISLHPKKVVGIHG